MDERVTDEERAAFKRSEYERIKPAFLSEPLPPDERGEPETYDEAVQNVHRAFCDPEHELVGEWDREMADALKRNGYQIGRIEFAPRRPAFLDGAWQRTTEDLLLMEAALRSVLNAKEFHMLPRAVQDRVKQALGDRN